eukprot:TRINITY_DN4974_c0_g1_i1.p1 TRINITY_DN4974_c0_g1~~TRINITY_DN4974_c0_g1_i1.p1  ORF type:complete len:159 (+),score=26.13 TRINITY_DN4974_c0_g1_i1:380-856(+)
MEEGPPPMDGSDLGTSESDFIKKSLPLLSMDHQRKLLERLLLDPLLSDIHPNALTPDYLDKIMAREMGKAVQIYLRKVSGETIPFIIAPETTLREFKKDVAREFSRREEPLMGGKKISWKYVWKNNCLMYNGVRLLDDSSPLYEWACDLLRPERWYFL